ncbi:MAG: carboxylating nicotinate-nucleotide diphosphorylase, partial [Candidatus Poribacteria bacterium]|nr:carboxylating nicotinate-nucleotide diphosphorylase [Candidatus Poribacteria bacterium]
TMVEPMTPVAKVTGCAKSILTGERTALNFLQRLSGTATLTAEFVDAVKNTKTKIVDTRKTTPGWRLLQKYAVRIGGGKNHRFGLYDGILIKDNHIVAAGGIRKAVEMARSGAPHTAKIEIEVETIDQVEEALKTKADILLLDNMSNETMQAAVKKVNGNAITEASGGITLDRIPTISKIGVNFISVGALTHSAMPLDMSLDLQMNHATKT